VVNEVEETPALTGSPSSESDLVVEWSLPDAEHVATATADRVPPIVAHTSNPQDAGHAELRSVPAEPPRVAGAAVEATGTDRGHADQRPAPNCPTESQASAAQAVVVDEQDAAAQATLACAALRALTSASAQSPTMLLSASDLEVLRRHAVLDDVLRRCITEQLISSVIFDEATLKSLRDELWSGLMLRLPPIDSADPDWFLNLDPSTRARLQNRWDDLRLRFWIETTYATSVEGLFLQRRHDLERWVYACLRVDDQTLAMELYLQLSEDGVDLGTLASVHGRGDERWTRGIVGPVQACRVPSPLRETLDNLAAGAIHAPIQNGDQWVVLQMLHRFPAELEGELRDSLLWERFEADLDGMVERLAQRLLSDCGEPSELLAQLSWQPLTVTGGT